LSSFVIDTIGRFDDNENMTENGKTLLFQLEQEIANLLLDKLEDFELSFERASKIAKFVLSHLPESLTDEQVMKILPSLDDEFFELAGIVYKHLSKYEEKYKDEMVDKVEDLIKHRHFEEANKLASDYFKRKFKPQ